MTYYTSTNGSGRVYRTLHNNLEFLSMRCGWTLVIENIPEDWDHANYVEISKAELVKRILKQ
jgi:hypothetical protein